MTVSITYLVASSFGKSYSLCIEIEDRNFTSKMRVQFHSLGGYCSGLDNELPQLSDGDKPQTANEGIDRTAAKKILGIIQGIRIGPYPDFVMGLDGTTFTLHFDSGFNKATYVWWVTLPIQWLELQPLVQCLEELITASRPDTDK
ncbi:MAG: hypothetical protein LAC69_00270 [Chlorobium sp.]|jgi:hypothetical protein|nr:hypothetical protein [Chlorobium sp.]